MRNKVRTQKQEQGQVTAEYTVGMITMRRIGNQALPSNLRIHRRHTRNCSHCQHLDRPNREAQQVPERLDARPTLKSI